MKLRIAMVGACPYPVPQGSQVLLRNTALALASRGHDVELVVYSHGIGEDNSGLTVHRCGGAPSWFPGARKTDAGPSFAKSILDIMLAKTLSRVVNERDIDVVCAHNYEALAVALMCRRRPIVYFAHNAMVDELPHFIPGSRRLGRLMDRTLPRRTDRVIAPHSALATYLIACGCPMGRVVCVPPCIEVERFERGIIRDCIPPVVYTGNLDRYQNLDLLMEAMKVVRERIPEARLVVATARETTIVGAEVVLTPDFDSLKRVLSEDCVVACPRVSWSGYPMKLLNIMASGRAAVACQSAAYPIDHEGNGLIVADNDVKGFAGALARLMEDPATRARLGREARAKAASCFSLDAVGKELEQVIASAVRERAHHKATGGNVDAPEKRV